MVLPPLINECTKVVYVPMSTGTDLYSILVGMGITMIIYAISDYLAKRGWVIEIDLKKYLKGGP